jgi:phage-related protein
MAAAQWLLNAALSANPIGLIIIAVVALVAAVILAYKHSDTFRAIVQKAGEVAVTAFKAVWDAIGPVVKIVKDVLGPVFTAYTKIVKTEIAIVVGVIGLAWDAVKTLIGWIEKIGVPGTIKAAFDAIKTAVGAVSTAIDTMIGWIKDITIPQVVKDLANPFNTAKTAVDAVSSAVETLIGWIKDIKFPSIPKGIGDLLPGGNMAPAHAYAAASGPTVGTRSIGGVPVSSGGGITININGAIDPYATAAQIRRILSRGAVISGRVTP